MLVKCWEIEGLFKREWNEILLKTAFQLQASLFYTHTHTKCAGKSQTVLTVPPHEWGRDCIYDNETLDKHGMFSESKWTLLISFSWPLLKLEPQIHAGCLGFTVHLLLYWGLTQGERGSGGHTERRWLPAAGYSDAKKNQKLLQNGEYALAHCIAESWCVNITGSINLAVHLSLNRCVYVSLTAYGWTRVILLIPQE